jgi:23S rRNA (cytidine1920-2'-O)/16S rRNA (cytidine1409-2'-O)-methyltransferase
VDKFVSRAGLKLDHALKTFKVDVNGLVCADFGSSTGGFVNCLLQNGAKKVFSVDTAYGELAWKLRNDPRVVVLERTNAMHVILPEKVDLITIDTGWTKQEKVIPNALKNLKENGLIISLIKPHYEAGKNKLSDEEIKEVLVQTKKNIENSGAKIVNIIESPIVGERAGNKEFLALIKPDPSLHKLD